jgi:hypothetical protein
LRDARVDARTRVQTARNADAATRAPRAQRHICCSCAYYAMLLLPLRQRAAALRKRDQARCAARLR